MHFSDPKARRENCPCDLHSYFTRANGPVPKTAYPPLIHSCSQMKIWRVTSEISVFFFLVFFWLFSASLLDVRIGRRKCTRNLRVKSSTSKRTLLKCLVFLESKCADKNLGVPIYLVKLTTFLLFYDSPHDCCRKIRRKSSTWEWVFAFALVK